MPVADLLRRALPTRDPAPLALVRVALAADPSTGALPSQRPTGSGKSGPQLSSKKPADALEANAETRGPLWWGAPGKPGLAHKMLRDPHVRASINYLADPLCAASWAFLPASESPLDQEAARFCAWALLERLPWRRYLRRIVRGYASMGFHFEELLDDYRPVPVERFPLHPGGGAGIVPTEWQHRPAWTVETWDGQPGAAHKLRSIGQKTATSTDAEAAGSVSLPADRLLRLTWDQDGADYWGIPVLRSAYQPWKLKMQLLIVDAIKHERTGVGVPAITLGEDATTADIDSAEEILAAMRANEKGYLVLPNGFSFEWTGQGEGQVSNIDAAIARCNVDIALNVAAGFMLLGLTGASGSHALAGTQQGAYHLTVDAHAAMIADAINLGLDGFSVVERLVRLNYGPEAGLPRLIARNLPTRDWQKIAQTVVQAVNGGVLTADDPLEDQLRASMDLGPRDPSTARSLTAMWLDPVGQQQPAAPDATPQDAASDPPADPTQTEPAP